MASGSRRRGRIIIYVALILILGLVLVWVLLSNNMGGGLFAQPVPTAPVEEMVNIVVTTQQIQRGSEFTEAVLATIPYPKKNYAPGTFYTSISEVVGKKAKIDMSPKVPVTESQVIDKLEGSFAAFQIPKGMVAVSIPITRLSSVSYAPQPGDHVNIIVSVLLSDLDTNYQTKLPNSTAIVIPPGPANLTASISSGPGGGEAAGGGSPVGRAEMETGLGQPIYVVPSEAQRPRMVSQTLLQDSVVLHVGNFDLPEEAPVVQEAAPAAAPAEGEQAAAAEPVAPKEPEVISLVVTPQDAITLNYLMFNNAKLTLALRGAGDDQRVQTEAVTLQYLMELYNIPVPAKLPYGMEPRVDDLGDTRLTGNLDVVATETPQ